MAELSSCAFRRKFIISEDSTIRNRILRGVVLFVYCGSISVAIKNAANGSTVQATQSLLPPYYRVRIYCLLAFVRFHVVSPFPIFQNAWAFSFSVKISRFSIELDIPLSYNLCRILSEVKVYE